MNPVKGHVQRRDKRKSHNSLHTDRHADFKKEIEARGGGWRWEGGARLPSAPIHAQAREAERRASARGERGAPFPAASLGERPGLREPERPGPREGREEAPSQGSCSARAGRCPPPPTGAQADRGLRRCNRQGRPSAIPTPDPENAGPREAGSGGRLGRASLEVTALQREPEARAAPWALSSGA